MEQSASRLDQLRTRATELERAVVAGDSVAIDRVLAAHPKYVDRRADRLEPSRFTLRDAQATVACELGFGDWAELLSAMEQEAGDPRDRWEHHAAEAAWHRRAVDEARALDHDWCGPEHLLLAVLAAREPTVARRVLSDMGVSHADVVARLPRGPQAGHGHGHVVTNPAFQMPLAMASGLALAAGSATPNDEHVLLAIAYRDDGRFVDVDPTQVVDRLRRSGIRVPPLDPVAPPTPIGPHRARVYFPRSDADAVVRLLRQRHPPGTEHWGFNHSYSRPGWCWVDGEDTIDMAGIARETAADPALVDVVALAEAVRVEDEARRARLAP